MQPPQEGCDHFIWYDEEMSVRAKEVINNLKVQKKILEKENKHLRRRYESGFNGDVTNAIDDILEDVRQLQKLRVAEEKKKPSAYACIIISWIFFAIVLLVLFVPKGVMFFG